MSAPGDPPPEVSTAPNPPSTTTTSGGQAKRFSRHTTSTAMSTRLATQTEAFVQTSTPATSVGTALTSLSDEFNPRVHRGIKVLKVTSHGATKPRVVTISNDKFTVFVTPAKVKSVKQNQRDNTSGRLVNVTRQVLPSAPTFSRKGIGFKSGVRDKYIRSIDVADINWVQVGYVGTKKLELGNTKSKRNVTKHSAGIVSIVHHGKETLDVLFANEEHAKSFVTALNSVLNTYHASKVHVGREELLLRYIWYDVDLNQNGLIDKKELHKILYRINAYVKSATVNKKYNEYLKMNTTTGSLRKAQGITYHQAMSLLEEIKREQNKDGKLMSDIIWDDLFGHSKSMVGPTEFLTKFLHETQHEMDATIADVETVFTHLNAMEIARGVLVQKTITGDGTEDDDAQLDYHASIDRIRFEAYLTSNMNDCYDPDAQELDTTTLTDPISYYWINTSHNTYLTGDQLRSASAVSMYNEALHRGCKCLELDCWDGDKAKNGKQPEPVVFHGHTLTSKIRFADIIDCVNSYVNANPNTYPIILSLENHCSHPFQKVMARVLKETLGTKLFIFNGRKSGLSVDGKLPSPEALRGMVVIKGKRPPDPDEEEEEEEEEEEDEEEDPYEMEGSATKVKDQKKPKIVPELAELTLFHGTKYKSFTTSMNAPPSHMHSIGETKINKILSQDPMNATLWRQYNVDHMTRTYPAGSRVDSSNYNPMVAWAMGSQLVALNFQSSDHCLLLNDGRFRQNGGCGYVKKPNSVMEREDDEEEGVVRGPVRLKVRVLSGSCLPKPNGDKGGEVVDPYVKVTLHDVTESDGSGGNVGDASFDERGKKEGNSVRDETIKEIKSVMTDNTTRERLVEHKHQTKVVDDNGFCPVWYETKFKEFTVHNPDVAMVLFSLRESDLGMFNDDKIADAAIPVSCLRKGYRSVQLYDTSSGSRWGPFDFATLLVEIDMEDVEVV